MPVSLVDLMQSQVTIKQLEETVKTLLATSADFDALTDGHTGEVSELRSSLADAQSRLGIVKKQVTSQIYFREWQEDLMDTVGTARGRLTIMLRGTRTSFMNELASSVGRDMVTAVFRRMVWWAARRKWHLSFKYLEKIEEVDENEDTVMGAMEV